MKVINNNENNFTVFLNDFVVEDDKKEEEIEESFKKLFIRLKEYYNFDIFGYYNISVYKDNNYGAILDIEKMDDEYFNVFDSSIDMKIRIEDNYNFLYQVNDPLDLKKIIDNISVYVYKNNFFVNIKEQISKIKMGQLLEISNIIYGDKVREIIKKGQII